jgi:hypothetical protein
MTSSIGGSIKENGKKIPTPLLGDNNFLEKINKIIILKNVQKSNSFLHQNQACNAAEQKVSFGHFGI